MFHASCKATGPSHPDNKTATPLLPLLLGPFSRQTDDYIATDDYELDRRWPYGWLGYST